MIFCLPHDTAGHPPFLDHFLPLFSMTTLVPHSPDHLPLPASLCSFFLLLPWSPLHVYDECHTLHCKTESVIYTPDPLLLFPISVNITTSQSHSCLSQKSGNLPPSYSSLHSPHVIHQQITAALTSEIHLDFTHFFPPLLPPPWPNNPPILPGLSWPHDKLSAL